MAPGSAISEDLWANVESPRAVSPDRVKPRPPATKCRHGPLGDSGVEASSLDAHPLAEALPRLRGCPQRSTMHQ
jgi:hypothetical protein